MKALVVASGIVFWTLVLGIAWLAFFPGSGGEPVAVLQIEPAGAPGAPEAQPEAAPVPEEPQSPAQASPDGMSLPPGFAVGPGGPQAPIIEPPVRQPGTTLQPIIPQPPPPPGALDDAMPAEDDFDQQGALPAEDTDTQHAAADVPAAVLPPPPPPMPGPESETASIDLPDVPVAELVEESQYGPLPKVAADGRRPIDVYARPSRYVAVAVGAPPRVAILVTGFGLPDAPSLDVLKDLPAPVSVAYGAYGRGLQDGVTEVRSKGHEVFLQIPLEPDNYPTEDPGPHTLLTSLPPEENLKRLQWLMSRYTGYVGVTNHMGAKFEAAPQSMQPVLEELKRRGLLYVDDGGPEPAVTGKIASSIGLDYLPASVKIDAQSDAEVATQLAQLEAAAMQQGAAVGVVSAKPVTLKQLAEWAGKLQAKGIVLVPVSAAVRSLRQS
ncbi:MAG: divergent polysaccharide deacetylase family protein [Methyloceanibacter sp.]